MEDHTNGARIACTDVASGISPTSQDVLRSRLLKDIEMITHSCAEIHPVNF